MRGLLVIIGAGLIGAALGARPPPALAASTASSTVAATMTSTPAVARPGGARGDQAEVETDLREAAVKTRRAVEAERAGDVRPAEATPDADAPTTLARRGDSDAPLGDRPFFVAAKVELRMLAVSDDDPANGRSLFWQATGGYRVFPGGLVFLRLGLLEQFVAEEGESGLLFEDVRLGMNVRHEVSLEPLGIDRDLSLSHWFSLTLPTSRKSLNQDLYAAPQLATRARFEVVDRVQIGLDLGLQYRFHEFAERVGPGAPMNTQLAGGVVAAVEVQVLESSRFGDLSVGADLHTTWIKRYASREEYESESSSEVMVAQAYGWDLYASYLPMKAVAVGISLEQGGSVLRNGLVNTFWAHRDETQLVFSLTGRY